MKWLMIAIVASALNCFLESDVNAQGCSTPPPTGGGGYGGYYYRTSLLGTGLFPTTYYQPTVRYSAPVRTSFVRYAAPGWPYFTPTTTIYHAPSVTRYTYTTSVGCATPPPTQSPPPTYGGRSERYYAPPAPPAAPRGRFDTRQCPGGF